MRYIESITLENFQSHKKTEIQPAGPGELTVIIGPSDSGKTAVIRGLRWAALNTPQGSDFIRMGTQGAEVAVTMSDKAKVSRYRTRGGVNRYKLISGADEQVYSSIGVSVPLEIQQALEITPTVIGDQEFVLNISEQLDGPFLGNHIPVTTKAKVLGKISGVEEVDHAGKTLGTDIYRKRREVEGLKNQVDHLAKQIEDYAFLDELGPMVEIVDASVKAIREKQDKKKRLLEMKIKAQSIQAAIAVEDKKIRELVCIEDLEQMLARTKEKQDTAARMETLKETWTAVMKDLIKTKGVLIDTAEIDDALDALWEVTERFSIHKTLLNLDSNRAEIIKSLAEVKQVLESTVKVPKAYDKVLNLPVQNGTLGLLVAKQKALGTIHDAMNNAVIALEATANVGELSERIEALDKLNSKCFDICRKRTLYNSSAEQIARQEKQIESYHHLVDDATVNLLNLFKEAGTCPMCGSQLEPEKLKEVE